MNVYLVATYVGGLMEHEGREWFQDKKWIEASNKEEACRKYDKIQGNDYFYGIVLAELVGSTLTILKRKGVEDKDIIDIGVHKMHIWLPQLEFKEINKNWWSTNTSGDGVQIIWGENDEEYHISFGQHEFNKLIYQGKIPSFDFLQQILINNKYYEK